MSITLNGTTGLAGTNGSAGTPAIQGEDTNTGVFFPAADTVAVATAGAERVRVDSSGNVLVGKTGANTATVGVEVSANGEMNATVSGGRVGLFNRLSSDGDIVQFRKDGTTVGSIGAYSGGMFIGSPVGSDAFLVFESNVVRPAGADGSNRDNVIDLGKAASRFNDIYAGNATIQTSDRNEKQQIAELTPAEMQAAKAISGLFKTFKWNDSVAEKGDAARIHSGVIAQEVEAAMADSGLDVGKYAFFISSTWWEADGQTYETAEEAPEGAVERTRRGIRYPELLAFVGAATEQRLASIEARLTELETQ
jgi:hypothetical protein